MTTDHVDDLKVVESIYVPEDNTSMIDDPLLKSNILILVANTTFLVWL